MVSYVTAEDSHPAVGGLLGRWKIQERHNMDEFLEVLGFGGFTRALLTKAGQEQEILHGEQGTLRIVTNDLRGSSTLELPLCGTPVQANDGDHGTKVCRHASIEGRNVVITERVPAEKEPLSVCVRSLRADGRMCIDVRKRTADNQWASMSTIFTKVAEPGDE